MILKVICTLLIFLSSVCCEGCITSTPCLCVTKNGTIDVTKVGNALQPRFSEVGFNESHLFSYNPCFPFDTLGRVYYGKGNKPCAQASACVKTPGNSDGTLPEEHAIGLQSTAQFGFNEIYNYHINYSVPGTERPQHLTVILKCDNEAKKPHIDIGNIEDDGNSVITLTSECACPGICSSEAVSNSGLSTGSKLLIAFFTIVLSYFIIGMIWNFCNGAQGLETVPNLDFWNDLPKLIVEGLVFTCSFCGRKSSYGEV